VSWLLLPDACVATIKLYQSRTKSPVVGSRDYRHVLHPCLAVIYLSPWLLRRFGLAARAISISRRIASGRPGLSG
jgi:hypothetical protein